MLWLLLACAGFDLVLLGALYAALRRHAPLDTRSLIAVGAGLAGFVVHALLYFSEALLIIQLATIAAVFGICVFAPRGSGHSPGRGRDAEPGPEDQARALPLLDALPPAREATRINPYASPLADGPAARPAAAPDGPIDRSVRVELQSALAAYMRGEINSFEFDERISPPWSKQTTTDQSAREIAADLWTAYDDFIDHGFSATAESWEVLRRILAFLGTDLEVAADADPSCWPFRDRDEWLRHAPLLDHLALPAYDPAIHGRPIQRWWNDVPYGLPILGLPILLIAVGVLLFILLTL